MVHKSVFVTSVVYIIIKKALIAFFFFFFAILKDIYIYCAFTFLVLFDLFLHHFQIFFLFDRAFTYGLDHLTRRTPIQVRFRRNRFSR
ncbi:unnamed protein product, partial [Candidula unifasciata]